MNLPNLRLPLSLLAAAALFSACGAGPDTANVDDQNPLSAQDELTSGGELLFKGATFSGNGRTCVTCHSSGTGTVNPQQLQALYSIYKQAPIFRAIDSDDGTGKSYNRLLTDATVLATIPLPANVKITGSTARTATFARGIPTTLDTPALDPSLMWDGRQPNLNAQALGAVNAHYQAKVQPTSDQLQKISDYEKTLFSSSTFKNFAAGGAAPTLPAGTTDSQKRGRAFFVESPNGTGLCAICHGGPMLNTISPYNQFGLPAGARYFSVFVSEFNHAQRPVFSFDVSNPDGTTTNIVTPDPGRFLITGAPQDVNAFKIPTLWNLKNTAPYFHDSSAKSLDDIAAHYNVVFQTIGLPALTAQEQADLVAYMKLL